MALGGVNLDYDFEKKFREGIEVLFYNRRKIKFKGCTVAVQSYYDEFNCKKKIKEGGFQSILSEHQANPLL